MSKREEEDLPTHVQICAERYSNIEDKFRGVESRLERIDTRIWAVLILIVGAVVLPAFVNFVKSFS